MERPTRARTAPRRFTDGAYVAEGTGKPPKTLKSKQKPARSSSRSRKATQRYDPEDDDCYEAPTKKSKSGKTAGKKKPKRPTNAKKVGGIATDASVHHAHIMREAGKCRVPSRLHFFLIAQCIHYLSR